MAINAVFKAIQVTQVEIILQQWEISTDSKWILVYYSNWSMEHNSKWRVILQQWDLTQTASGDCFYSNGRWHRQQVGLASTAMGWTQQQVEIFYSNGRNTTASGYYSTAMGYGTTASDYGSLVIGQYNSSGSSVTNSATSFSYIKHSFCDWKWSRFLKQIGCF